MVGVVVELVAPALAVLERALEVEGAVLDALRVTVLVDDLGEVVLAVVDEAALVAVGVPERGQAVPWVVEEGLGVFQRVARLNEAVERVVGVTVRVTEPVGLHHEAAVLVVFEATLGAAGASDASELAPGVVAIAMGAAVRGVDGDELAGRAAVVLPGLLERVEHADDPQGVVVEQLGRPALAVGAADQQTGGWVASIPLGVARRIGVGDELLVAVVLEHLGAPEWVDEPDELLALVEMVGRDVALAVAQVGDPLALVVLEVDAVEALGSSRADAAAAIVVFVGRPGLAGVGPADHAAGLVVAVIQVVAGGAVGFDEHAALKDVSHQEVGACEVGALEAEDEAPRVVVAGAGQSHRGAVGVAQADQLGAAVYELDVVAVGVVETRQAAVVAGDLEVPRALVAEVVDGETAGFARQRKVGEAAVEHPVGVDGNVEGDDLAAHAAELDPVAAEAQAEVLVEAAHPAAAEQAAELSLTVVDAQAPEPQRVAELEVEASLDDRAGRGVDGASALAPGILLVGAGGVAGLARVGLAIVAGAAEDVLEGALELGQAAADRVAGLADQLGPFLTPARIMFLAPMKAFLIAFLPFPSSSGSLRRPWNMPFVGGIRNSAAISSPRSSRLNSLAISTIATGGPPMSTVSTPCLRVAPHATRSSKREAGMPLIVTVSEPSATSGGVLCLTQATRSRPARAAGRPRIRTFGAPSRTGPSSAGSIPSIQLVTPDELADILAGRQDRAHAHGGDGHRRQTTGADDEEARQRGGGGIDRI
ncbi:hypothetical protein OV079_47620 [Nannocystis pusilla]|uniref:Uncharacterized protein n=1 Tax=Nannocystis pusilla TaxID=889268 RepID=A0A9X3J4F5_9BACT|nr:hypothetical protein [Nannocystis pusilla]